MSSYACRTCGAVCLDEGFPRGYISGCEEYPVPDHPGPYLSEIWALAKEHFGPYCPETKLAKRCVVYRELYRAGMFVLTDEEKMLLLLLGEMWKWRRVE